MYSKNNDKTKYEEKINDYIMEHEEDNVIEYLESEKKKTLDSLNEAKNEKKFFINSDEILSIIFLIVIIFSLCAKIDLLVEMFSCGIVVTNIYTIIMKKAINNDIKSHESQLQFLEEKLKEEKEKQMSKEKNKYKNPKRDIPNRGISPKEKFYELRTLAGRYSDIIDNYIEEKGKTKIKVNYKNKKRKL